jgi:hypothetical protein
VLGDAAGFWLILSWLGAGRSTKPCVSACVCVAVLLCRDLFWVGRKFCLGASSSWRSARLFFGGGRLAGFVFACVFGNGFWFWNGKERWFLKLSLG